MRQVVIVLAAFLFSFGVMVPAAAEPPLAPPGAPTKEEEAFINQYLDRLLYMVYLNDKIKIAAGEEYLYRKAISAANDYLTAKKIDVVLYEQVEELRKDETLLAEELQRENLTVVQWLAQKFNADIYIEIDVLVTSEKRGSQHYAQANLTIKVFEPSTAQLLGSKSYNQLDRTVGANAELAKSNAVQICVTRIMNEVIQLARANLRSAIAQGLRYELKLLGTKDTKTVLDFIELLRSASTAVESIKAVTLNDREGKYQVFFFGRPEDFKLLILDTAKTIPALRGLQLEAYRGKSFTFTTGL